MKRLIIIFIGFITFYSQGSAQDLYFQKQEFINKIDNKIATLTAEEKKEQAIILQNKLFIEYAETTPSNEIGRFYGLMRRVHINEAGAIDSYNKISLPISTNSDLVALKVRSISPKGVVKELGEESVKETEEDGKKYKIVAVEGLEQGSEVEFFYIVRTPISIFGQENLHKTVPIRESEFLIVAPSNLKFETKLYHTSGIKKDTVIDSKAYLGYLVSNLVPLYEEKYATNEANMAFVEYKLAYNTAKDNSKIFSWKDAGKTMFDVMHQTSKDSNKEIEKILKKEKIVDLPEESAIRAIENFIKSNIAIKEGADQMLPDEVLKSKFGDESSITRLYVQCFDAVNINYELIVGVNRYKKRFDKTFETWNMLDKYYFYFPNSKKYIDPNNPLTRFGLIDASMEGTDALFISNITLGEMKTSIAKIKNIPFSSANTSFDNINADVSFPKTLDAVNIKLNRSMGGHLGGGIKGYFMLSNDEQRKQLLANVLKASLNEDAIFSNSVAKNYNLNSDEADKEFIISTDVTAKSMIEKAGNKYFFKIGDIIGPQVEMYNERPRQQPIDIGNAHTYLRKIVVHVPEGYKVRGLESIKRNIVFDYEGKKAMGFVVDYQLSDNSLTLTIDEYYNIVQLPVSAYAEFQKVINASADFNKLTLIFE